MNESNLPGLLLETVLQQMPASASWMPMALAAVVGAFGLVVLIKGARLAPVLATLAGTVILGACGGMIAGTMQTPFWPTTLVAAVGGGLLGLLLLRFWIAILVAGCLMTAGLGIYTQQVLMPSIVEYKQRGLDLENQEAPITLQPAPEDAAAQATAVQSEAQGLWDYLVATVPNFEPAFFTIVIATGLTGLIFGLLLPKTSRAVWAATFGTGLVIATLYGALHALWPTAAAWLDLWGVYVIAGMWLLSLIVNLADVQEVRLVKGRKPAAATE
jgi:hypothetical protein